MSYSFKKSVFLYGLSGVSIPSVETLLESAAGVLREPASNLRLEIVDPVSNSWSGGKRLGAFMIEGEHVHLNRCEILDFSRIDMYSSPTVVFTSNGIDSSSLKEERLILENDVVLGVPTSSSNFSGGVDVVQKWESIHPNYYPHFNRFRGSLSSFK